MTMEDNKIIDFVYDIPEHTFHDLRLYVEKGVLYNSFLYSFLTNDLKGAMCGADSRNLYAFAAVFKYVFNNIPSCSWGSKENVEEWMRHNGMEGE